MVNVRTASLSAALCGAFVVGVFAGVVLVRYWHKAHQRDPIVPRQEMMALSRMSPTIIMLGDFHTEFATWPELTGCPGVANFGIAGNTSADIVARLPSVIDARPRAVLLMIGTNDLLRGIDAADTASNVTRIAQRLAAENIQVAIQAIPPILGQESLCSWLSMHA